MVLVYYDPLFLEHDTGHHPENAARLAAIWQRLAASSLFAELEQRSWETCAETDLERVHDDGYLQWMCQLCLSGGGRVDGDTVASPRSWEVAVRAASAVVDAVDRVVGGTANAAACLIRPPGHHARSSSSMGFCLLGNVAIAAARAVGVLGLQRVLVVDWDVHHGNGTQEMFWRDPAVGFFSMHRWPFYPGTGAADEVGEGPGRGYTCNLPIEYGTPPPMILQQFTETLTRFAERVRPELILISAGFDAHRLDPIGSLDLQSSDFVFMTNVVQQLADTYANGRIVSALEGGYHPQALAECVELHLQALARTAGS
jgi:acetoin utilization deacetylase AcuC-like enzyme